MSNTSIFPRVPGDCCGNCDHHANGTGTRWVWCAIKGFMVDPTGWCEDYA
jgi:hypothetical protein